MLIYLVNFALICLYWLICIDLKKKEPGNKKMNDFFVVLIAIQIISIIAFRGLSVGIDTSSYYRRFNTYRLMAYEDIFDHCAGGEA